MMANWLNHCDSNRAGANHTSAHIGTGDNSLSGGIAQACFASGLSATLSTLDARARANSNANPLILLACNNRSHLHLLCVALRVLCG